MRIGIDISQLAFQNTGVANYLENFVQSLIESDRENEYILFFSSMRGQLDPKFAHSIESSRVKVKKYRMPLSLLDLLWNKLHIAHIEMFTGALDIFVTSDWVEPPTKKAKKATILYDLIVYKYPHESTAKIIETQKRKLKWVKQESKAIFCISQATKNDVKEILKISEEKLHVIYPGFTL